MRFKNKGWYQPPAPIPAPVKEAQPSQVQTVISADEPKKQEGFFFKCIKCFGKADLMFQGTSYCEPCLKEQLRTG